MPSEGAVKVIGTLAFGNSLVEPKKSAAIVIASEEVVKLGDANLNALFDAELRLAVAYATDQDFIAGMIASTTPIPSSGTTYSAVMDDFSALFAAVTMHAGSKLFYIISAQNLKNMMFITGPQGWRRSRAAGRRQLAVRSP